MTDLLRDLWYFAAASAELAPGKHFRREILSEPVLLGRGADGKAFALRDICPHRAVPLTGALCLAVATRLPGTIPNTLARGLAADAAQIRIAHPSGTILVDAKVTGGTAPSADYAAVYRTARRLFEGRVLVR